MRCRDQLVVLPNTQRSVELRASSSAGGREGTGPGSAAVWRSTGHEIAALAASNLPVCNELTEGFK